MKCPITTDIAANPLKLSRNSNLSLMCVVDLIFMNEMKGHLDNDLNNSFYTIQILKNTSFLYVLKCLLYNLQIVYFFQAIYVIFKNEKLFMVTKKYFNMRGLNILTLPTA
jgi:hypothetical protein